MLRTTTRSIESERSANKSARRTQIEIDAAAIFIVALRHVHIQYERWMQFPSFKVPPDLIGMVVLEDGSRKK